MESEISVKSMEFSTKPGWFGRVVLMVRVIESTYNYQHGYPVYTHVSDPRPATEREAGVLISESSKRDTESTRREMPPEDD